MKKSYLLIFAALCAASCLDKEPDVPEAVEAYTVAHEMIVLGEQLEDPYSLGNMTKALQSVYGTKASRVTLTATNVYVRFLPAEDKDFDTLRLMGVDLVDHPLDYSIVVDGDYYHDPDLPEDSITWQYAVVSPDFAYPEGIRYEILDECYIPDTGGVTRADGDGFDWAEVEREAFRLTGNEDMLEPLTKGEKLKPSGDIQIVDPDYNGGNPVGVAGVKVAVNTFVKFATAYTDEDGHYEIKKSFSSRPRYRLVFHNRKGFGIGVNLVLVQGSVSTLGKNPASGVNVTIDASSNRKLFTRCVVNNAAYDWYTRCTAEDSELAAPPSNLRIWLFQKVSDSAAPMMRQGVFVDSGIVKKYLGDYTMLIKMFLPDITLGMSGKQTYREIYDDAVHQLCLSTLYSRVGRSWWSKFAVFLLRSYVTSGGVKYGSATDADSGYCEVAEMWAWYMQYLVMRERYGADTLVAGTSWWFSPQILWYMDERGLGCDSIFKAYTSEVIGASQLKESLTSLYPEHRSMIDQAFERYSR